MESEVIKNYCKEYERVTEGMKRKYGLKVRRITHVLKGLY